MGIGFLIIWHSKERLLFSVAGIAMAVAIMFLEQGFYYAVLDSQARITPLINGELVVVHRDRTHLNKWNSLERAQIHRVAALRGVERVIPVYKINARLYNEDADRQRRVLVYAFPADAMPLKIGDPDEVLSRLRLARTVLFDRRSRDIYGQLQPGTDLEIDGAMYRFDGFVDIGPDLVSDGALVMSEGTLFERHPSISPVMAVLQLVENADPASVRERMMESFTNIMVMTPSALAAREMHFIKHSAPIGIIFGIGMVAGLVIGVVVCYQVLFNQIIDLLPQYATLTAMGFSQVFIARLVVEQALLMCLTGYVVAVPVVWYLFTLLADHTRMVMALDLDRGLFVFGLTVFIGVLAALLALQTALRANPADLY